MKDQQMIIPTKAMLLQHGLVTLQLITSYLYTRNGKTFTRHECAAAAERLITMEKETDND